MSKEDLRVEGRLRVGGKGFTLKEAFSPAKRALQQAL